MNMHNTTLYQLKKYHHLFDLFLSSVDTIAQFCVVIAINTAVGWLFGFYVGQIYVEHYQPVYLSQYSILTEISEWSSMPFSFAIMGAYIGANIGAITALIIYVKTHF